MSIKEKLKSFLTDECVNERVGFVLSDESIVEVENVCPEPDQGFEVSGSDFIKYENEIIATWHTHPNQDNCLSTNDYRTYLSFPDYQHYIVGTNGVQEYKVEDGIVVRVC